MTTDKSCGRRPRPALVAASASRPVSNPAAHQGLLLGGLLENVAAAVLAFLLGGCGVEIPITKSTVEADLPARDSPIEAGKSDRAAVRQLLGEPWVASDDWRFDLFRVSDSNVTAPVMFVFWWPVPLGVAVDQITGYVLVTYDADGRVVQHEHGFARDPTVYDSGSGDVSAHLVAGDLRFGADQDENEAFLSVAAQQRDDYLRAHSSQGRCTVLIGCEDYSGGVRFAIDGHPSLPTPDKDSTFHSALRIAQVSAGPHRIEISPMGSHDKFQAMSDIVCSAGETIYGMIRLEYEQRAWFSEKWRATITVSREMPEAFRDRRLLIWGNGKWLLPQEPGR